MHLFNQVTMMECQHLNRCNGRPEGSALLRCRIRSYWMVPRNWLFSWVVDWMVRA